MAALTNDGAAARLQRLAWARDRIGLEVDHETGDVAYVSIAGRKTMLKAAGIGAAKRGAKEGGTAAGEAAGAAKERERGQGKKPRASIMSTKTGDFGLDEGSSQSESDLDEYLVDDAYDLGELGDMRSYKDKDDVDALSPPVLRKE